MTKSEDIVNLFQQFGGQVDDYQELSRQQSAQQAKKRWPLLSALELGQATAATAPGVAAAEAPVIAGPIEFRPAPIAPPVQALAPTGQHLSAAELALDAPTPVSAPVADPHKAPVQASPSLSVAIPTAPPAVAPAAPAAPTTPAATQAAPASVPNPSTLTTTAVASVASAILEPSAAPVVPAPLPAPLPEPTVLAPRPWSAAVPAPLTATTAPTPLTGTSPLAGLAQATRPTPAPAAATPPATELQGIFARLAGRTEVAAPPQQSGLSALWQNLRGGA